MHVQVHSGKVGGDKNMNVRFGEEIAEGLRRFADRISSVHAYFGDENGAKAGDDDKRCTIEARLAGMPPMAATGWSSNFEQAFNEALDKLTAELDSAEGRLEDRRGHPNPGMDQLSEPQ